ncbi:MAG TPA: hypothetical protein VGM56_02600, partial [Byssovorax sp.]
MPALEQHTRIDDAGAQAGLRENGTLASTTSHSTSKLSAHFRARKRARGRAMSRTLIVAHRESSAASSPTERRAPAVAVSASLRSRVDVAERGREGEHQAGSGVETGGGFERDRGAAEHPLGAPHQVVMTHQPERARLDEPETKLVTEHWVRHLGC